MVDAVLFDLDGTLLPMDQEEFVKGYFGALCRRFAPLGYEPKRMIDVVWKGTGAMVRNDGSMTNCERFWQVFAEEYGQERLKDVPLFDDFYAREFNEAAAMTQPTPLARRCVKAVREKGIPVVLATNPIFPRVATLGRIRWAGLDAEDFAYITTYENSTRCKPNPGYFAEICEKVGLRPEKCLMVGNDYLEDLAAAKIGMDTFLVTDCLIAPEGADLDAVPHGTMETLLAALESCQ
ncbi:MAG: HAD family hydrolase [Candidatus Spyradocola sp.]